MLEQRVGVVTGAGQGIGRAIAEALARDGVHVVATDVAESVQQTAAAMASAGDSGEAALLDVGDIEATARFVRDVYHRHGRLDVWVNNAAVSRGVDFFDIDPDTFDWVFRVNARGTFFALQAAGAVMVEQGWGSIINISSVAAKGWGGASNMAYAATKAAVVNMTRMASQRLGPHGITVNCICPGVTNTDLMRGVMEMRSAARGVPLADTMSAIESTIPTRRINEPADIAAAAVFLASAGARNISGQSINIDGGRVFD